MNQIQFKHIIIIIFLLFFITSINAQRNNSILPKSPEEAKEELKRLNVTYNVDSFIERCFAGNTYLVQLFLLSGYSPNIKNSKGVTGLISASMRGNVETVKVLLDAGADINAKTESGNTAIIYAISRGYKELTKILTDAGADKNEAMDYAVRRDDVPSAKNALELGIDINYKDEGDMTYLMKACHLRRIDIISFLIKHGAKIDEKNIYGTTALMLASYHCSTTQISMLLKAQADPNLSDKLKRTPIWYATARKPTNQKQDFSDIVKLLLSSGANPDTQDYEGSTPLMNAVKTQQIRSIEMLLKHGADPNLRDNRGNTAFLLAEKLKDTKVMDVLNKNKKKSNIKKK